MKSAVLLRSHLQARRTIAALLAGAILLLAGCGRSSAPAGPKAIHLTSPTFADGATLPTKYTCDGAGVSPPLAWSGLPARTKSLAVVCQDPDAPGGVFTHWLLWNVPAGAGSLAAGAVPAGARQGGNDFGGQGYGAPCPPAGSGVHRYIFTLYALDDTPDLPAGATKEKLFAAMKGHILAEGQVTGRYERS